MLMVVTALVGLFITVIIYISKIFNVKSEVAEIHEIKEHAIPEEKPRKKSESVGKISINKYMHFDVPLYFHIFTRVLQAKGLPQRSLKKRRTLNIHGTNLKLQDIHN